MGTPPIAINTLECRLANPPITISTSTSTTTRTSTTSTTTTTASECQCQDDLIPDYLMNKQYYEQYAPLR